MGRLFTRYSPVRHSQIPERICSFDLHVLSMPPAFILSQNQTLKFNCLKSLLAKSNNGSNFVISLLTCFSRSPVFFDRLVWNLTEITLFACLSNNSHFFLILFLICFCKAKASLACPLAATACISYHKPFTLVKHFFKLFLFFLNFFWFYFFRQKQAFSFLDFARARVLQYI